MQISSSSPAPLKGLRVPEHRTRAHARARTHTHPHTHTHTHTHTFPPSLPRLMGCQQCEETFSYNNPLAARTEIKSQGSTWDSVQKQIRISKHTGLADPGALFQHTSARVGGGQASSASTHTHTHAHTQTPLSLPHVLRGPVRRNARSMYGDIGKTTTCTTY